MVWVSIRFDSGHGLRLAPWSKGSRVGPNAGEMYWLHGVFPNRSSRIVTGHPHNAPLVQWLERELAKFETPVRFRQGALVTCSSGSASGCNPVPVRIVTAARLHGSAQGLGAAPSKRMQCGSTPQRTTTSGSSSWPRNSASHADNRGSNPLPDAHAPARGWAATLRTSLDTVRVRDGVRM